MGVIYRQSHGLVSGNQSATDATICTRLDMRRDAEYWLLNPSECAEEIDVDINSKLVTLLTLFCVFLVGRVVYLVLAQLDQLLICLITCRPCRGKRTQTRSTRSRNRDKRAAPSPFTPYSTRSPMMSPPYSKHSLVHSTWGSPPMHRTPMHQSHARLRKNLLAQGSPIPARGSPGSTCAEGTPLSPCSERSTETNVGSVIVE